MSEDSRRQFVRKNVLIREDQDIFIQNDADNRYPERHGPKQLRRNYNPAHRDGLDFWKAHYHLFLTWIATRGNTATGDTEGTQP